MGLSETAHDDVDRPEDEQHARDDALLDRHLDQLLEHFSSVQIFVTRLHPKDDTTAATVRGRGDWYARYGCVKNWIVREDAKTHFEVKPDE